MQVAPSRQTYCIPCIDSELDLASTRNQQSDPIFPSQHLPIYSNLALSRVDITNNLSFIQKLARCLCYVNNS